MKGPRVCRCCQGKLGQPWELICSACWKLLPVDVRASVQTARKSKAAHLISEACIGARDWLREHNPAALAERITGEAAR